MQNEKLLNAKKHLRCMALFKESVEHIMQTNNKIELAVGSIVLFNMFKEKLPQLSNEQLEEMLSYAFAKEDEDLEGSSLLITTSSLMKIMSNLRRQASQKK